MVGVGGRISNLGSLAEFLVRILADGRKRGWLLNGLRGCLFLVNDDTVVSDVSELLVVLKYAPEIQVN